MSLKILLSNKCSDELKNETWDKICFPELFCQNINLVDFLSF